MKQIEKTTLSLTKRLNSSMVDSANIIPWSSPIPVFGDIEKSTVATLGLNPSNREFVDTKGNELDGSMRRFHTLRSLKLKKWNDASGSHINKILESCTGYFLTNPYDAWFKKLDDIISGAGVSYYDRRSQACHLDLIPYATEKKWSCLTKCERDSLIDFAGDTLALLLRNSNIQLLILNGSGVINGMESICSTQFTRKEMNEWSLPRRSGSDVKGYSYTGYINDIAGVELKKKIKIIGFNHNIQSSFGVTTKVKSSIKKWISKTAE